MLAPAALLETPAQNLRRLWPGLALCLLVALASSFVATQQHAPPMLLALLFGMALNYQCRDKLNSAGIGFCSSTLLRVGIGLLGARISWHQVVDLGWPTAVVVLAAVTSTLVCGLCVARVFGLNWTIGVLAGGATAICGASAALAIGAVLPRAGEGETSTDRHALVVAVMATLLSTVAMLTYPYIARTLELTAASAGLFIGGSIHDVAQVVVAGYSISPSAGDAASLVKLLRVSLLAVVVLAVSVASHSIGGASDRPQLRPSRIATLIPGFLWLFIAMAMFNSFGLLGPLRGVLDAASHACLIVGVAGLGIKTSFADLASAGRRVVLLMLWTSAWIAAITLGAATILSG